jgi:aerobic carbon-monoxide dehydrogenase medium subunit
MKAPAFDYVAPRTLDEALQALSSLENARVLAGGQSLVAMLNMRFAFPDHLVDINRVQELSFIQDSADCVGFGAMTRQRDVEFSEVVQRRLPILREAILNVGHRQTRNRGTIGGSLCQLDPSAEVPTIAMAMDATVTARSVRGQREIRMADFPAGYMTPSLEPDEMLTALSIRPWSPRHGYAFEEYARRHGDFAIASAAALIEFDTHGIVARASITLGGISSTPVKVPAAEQVLLGSRATAQDIEAAAALCSQVEATTDSYVPGWYRKHLAKVLCQRTVEKAISRADR